MYSYVNTKFHTQMVVHYTIFIKIKQTWCWNWTILIFVMPRPSITSKPIGFLQTRVYECKKSMLNSNSTSSIRQSDILKLKISLLWFHQFKHIPVYFWLPNFKHIMDKLDIIPIFLNIGKVTKSITIYCDNSQCFQIEVHDSIFINITLGKYVEVIYVLVHFNGCP